MTLVYKADPAQTKKWIAMIGGAFFVGGLAGAVVGEFVQSKAGTGGQPFLAALSFFMVLGGLFLGFFAIWLVALEKGNDQIKGGHVLAAIAIGSFLGGLGARRAGAKGTAIFFGSFLTGGLWFPLILKEGDKAVAGAAVILLGIMICAVIGGLFGKIGLRQEPTPT
jgi:hypothetical protein